MFNNARHLHLLVCRLNLKSNHHLDVAEKRLGCFNTAKLKFDKLSQLFARRIELNRALSD